MKVSAETASAINLANEARFSPAAMTASPPKIGSQISKLRMGQSDAIILFVPLLQHHPNCDHSNQTHNHRKGILEQETALPKANPGG